MGSDILRDAVQALLDKQAITEVLHRYCRGMDRMDRELSLSCWHPDGTADYGQLFKGLGSEFVDWVWPIHMAMERTYHTVHNILIELDGDQGYSESYWLAYLRSRDKAGLLDTIGGGRYLDHFERREGSWRIKHRTVIFDWDRLDHATPHFGQTPGIPPQNPNGVTLRGMRSVEDYSYRLLRQTHTRDGRPKGGK